VEGSAGAVSKSHLGAAGEEPDVSRVKGGKQAAEIFCNLGGTTELERAFVPYHIEMIWRALFLFFRFQKRQIREGNFTIWNGQA
jgi:hypothetical protein